jgi:HEPN domain-containing protein
LPRKTDSHNPADWLYFVESDLTLLRVAAERELAFELACSKLAECLEKLIKAELIRQGWALVKTHDLLLLAEELDVYSSDLLPAILPLAQSLSEMYFADRYPGFDLEDPDWPTYRRQLGNRGSLCGDQAPADESAICLIG